jgi:CheY-like chemotaxis protein
VGAAAAATEQSSPPSISGVVHRPWRVLLVDDDDDNREICAEFLIRAGYEIVQAENGADGIEVALRRKPDLIVMDLEMPVMGGLEAIRRLRLEPGTCATPVVVLSANGIVDHTRAERVGSSACLAKPCDLDDLEGIIHILIDTAQLAAPEPESVAG